MTVPRFTILLNSLLILTAQFALADDASGTVATTADPQHELSSWLDSRFESRWEANHVEPPPVVDDATFLRRVYLDLRGTIPSVSQTRDFLASDSAN